MISTKEYTKFDIIKVANDCGIQFHPRQRNPMEHLALCPFCADTSYHLYINPVKERFKCQRCGADGNSVSLYARIHGITNAKAASALKNAFKLTDESFPEIYNIREIPTVETKSLKERHAVYYDMLQLLYLTDKHRQNLISRGLSDKHINQFMYKSIPLDDVFRRVVIETLSAKYDLIGIPGFYRDKHGDIQMFINRYGGMLIPVCDKDGYIQGLQMRLDIPEGVNEKRFRWFSSSSFRDGAKVKSWIHIVGDVHAEEACITEGPMKSDISSVLSGGWLFIGLPGVNCIEILPEVLQRFPRLKRVYEALDMDKVSNPNVKKALIKLNGVLDIYGVEHEKCYWNYRYKGIDDYLLAKQNYVQSGVEVVPLAA